MIAQQPANEKERLATLRGYEILDTEPEAGFDDLTLLASYICQTPIALISLIDVDRQWFKSKVGLSLSETSRDIAFALQRFSSPMMFSLCLMLLKTRGLQRILWLSPSQKSAFTPAQL